jgi:formamidopyrimidine-DNA glycosylase
MPELPEVHCQAQFLHAQVEGKKVESIRFFRGNLRNDLDQKALTRIFTPGAVTLQVTRWHKKILWTTDKGAAVISLGMSGGFLVRDRKDPLLPHEHICVVFENGTKVSYLDPRRFGMWEPMVKGTLLQNLQIVDALDKKGLLALYKNLPKFRPIKDFLMDQKWIGGVGNIYACEVLFTAGIHPLLPCGSLTFQKWERVVNQLQELLGKSIQLGGSTIHTFKSADGKKGGFTAFHQVYGREGQPCLTSGCLGCISKVTCLGRSTFYCEICQTQ